jgi:hypothetical protein
VDDIELVKVALSGLPESWKPFLQGICAQEKLPTFDRLWTNCIQEEARLECRSGKQKGNSDEYEALVARARKGGKGGSPERGISKAEEEEVPYQGQVLCLSRLWPLCFIASISKERGKKEAGISS